MRSIHSLKSASGRFRSCAMLALAALVISASSSSVASAATVSAYASAMNVGTGEYSYDTQGYLFFTTEPPMVGANLTGLYSTSSTYDTVNLPNYVASVPGTGPAKVPRLRMVVGYTTIALTSR